MYKAQQEGGQEQKQKEAGDKNSDSSENVEDVDFEEVKD